MNNLPTFQGNLGAASIGERIDSLIAAGRLKQVAVVDTKPTNVPEKSIDEVEGDFKPWYKKWWVWGLVGVGVVGTGLTIHFVVRRRR